MAVLFILKRIFYGKLRITHVIAFMKYNSIKKFSNFLNSNFERLIQRHTLTSKPYLINSEPTNNCFLNCPFCLTGKINSRTNGFASPFLYDKIFKEIAEYTYVITFHGWGEPLLYKNLHLLIEMANKNRICTVVTTNGLLLDKKTASNLLKPWFLLKRKGIVKRHLLNGSLLFLSIMSMR